jgi:hypothetical protein
MRKIKRITKHPHPLLNVSIVLSPFFLISNPSIRQNAKNPNISISLN